MGLNCKAGKRFKAKVKLTNPGEFYLQRCTRLKNLRSKPPSFIIKIDILVIFIK